VRRPYQVPTGASPLPGTHGCVAPIRASFPWAIRFRPILGLRGIAEICLRRLLNNVGGYYDVIIHQGCVS